MNKKLVLMFSLILVTSSMLAACGDDKESSTDKGTTKKRDQVVNLAVGDEIPSMDSAKATDNVSFNVMNNTMEGLYRLDKNNQPTPGIAESYTKSDDGLVYTFKLRDAKWSNGDKVVAGDFVFAWRKLQDPKTAGEYAYIMQGIVKNATEVNQKKLPVDQLGVKAIDDQTLEVTLANPVPYFLGLTTFPSFYPQNEKFVTEQKTEYAKEASNLVFNGPFKMTEWKHGNGFKLEKNESYWDAKTVKLKQLNYTVVKEVSTSVNLYNTGKLDRAGLSQEFVNKYKNDKNFKKREDASVFFLRINEKNPTLKNVKVRKALSLAIDKKAFVDVILNNGSQPANYIVPKNFTFGPEGTDYEGKDFRETNGDFNKYNPSEAKKLWKEAQKELGTDKVEIGLLNFDGEDSKKMGEYFKAQIEQNLPGVTVKLKQQPFKQKLALESKGEFDLSFAGWGPDYQDPMTFLDMFTTNNSHNQMSYSSPAYDKLVKDAQSTLMLDLGKRWEALLAAEKQLLETDAALVPLYQRGSAYLQQGYLKDVYNHTFGADSSYKWAYVE